MHFGYAPGVSVAEMTTDEAVERLGTHLAVQEYGQRAASDKSWFDGYLSRSGLPRVSHG